MSRSRYQQSMPPGLKSQIVFAVIITLCALFLLPTALSAGPGNLAWKEQVRSKPPSAGSVSVTLHDFNAVPFVAASFSDWEK